LRTVLILFTVAALLFAINSQSTMYEMIQEAYSVTLVGALVPLAAGVFWKRATVQGALLSIIFGETVWLFCVNYSPEFLVPPQLVGVVAAIVGMVIGSLAPQSFYERQPAPTGAPGGQAWASRLRAPRAAARIPHGAKCASRGRRGCGRRPCILRNIPSVIDLGRGSRISCVLLRIRPAVCVLRCASPSRVPHNSLIFKTK